VEDAGSSAEDFHGHDKATFLGQLMAAHDHILQVHVHTLLHERK
jgi:hypothetical protein